MNILRKQLLKKLQQNTRKHQKESDEHDMTEREQVTNQDARKCIAGLLLYFMKEVNESSPISALDTCADFVQLQSVKIIWQGILDKFLQHH
jgi:hypothetical protein